MQWMAWTVPTAGFFITIGVLLMAMTLWELIVPSIERRGRLLPMPTTRGDRLFVGLLLGAYINLAWVGLTELSLWWSVAATVLVVAIMLRWG